MLNQILIKENCVVYNVILEPGEGISHYPVVVIIINTEVISTGLLSGL